jgi:NTE family protein
MLEALFERAITPDLIIGSSAGAINGAFIASREPTVQTAKELGAIWRGLNRGSIFPLSPVTGLIGFVGRGTHVVPSGNLRRLVAGHARLDRLEDARVPLHVIATDVLSGGELRLSTGPAVDAVMASAAIPGVFAPVSVDGALMIDGGVCDNTPISHAIELGAEEIYVLPTGFSCDLEAPPAGGAQHAAARHEPDARAASAPRDRALPRAGAPHRAAAAVPAARPADRLLARRRADRPRPFREPDLPGRPRRRLVA